MTHRIVWKDGLPYPSIPIPQFDVDALFLLIRHARDRAIMPSDELSRIATMIEITHAALLALYGATSYPAPEGRMYMAMILRDLLGSEAPRAIRRVTAMPQPDGTMIAHVEYDNDTGLSEPISGELGAAINTVARIFAR